MKHIYLSLTCLMILNFSCKYFEAKIDVTSTLSAPNGVTREAGAKAYAAKFNNSPIPTKILTEIGVKQHLGLANIRFVEILKQKFYKKIK